MKVYKKKRVSLVPSQNSSSISLTASFQPRHDEIEALIRQDAHAKALQILRSEKQEILRSRRKVALVDRLMLARFFRRLGYARDCLGLLKPVCDDGIVGLPSSHGEVAVEYANALVTLGVREEARRILNHSKLQADPQYLSQAWGRLCTTEWDYRSAFVHWRKVSARQDSFQDSYLDLIARVNAFAAAVFLGQQDYVETEQRALSQSGELKESRRLYLSFLRVCQTRFLNAQKWHDSVEIGEEIKFLGSKNRNTVDRLLDQKWRVIMQLSRDPSNYRVQRKFEYLKEQARKLKQPEILRDLDFQLGLCRGDVQKIRHVYFGTAMPHYRSYLLGLAQGRGLGLTWPDTLEYDFLSQGDTKKKGDRVDSQNRSRIVNLRAYENNLELKEDSIRLKILRGLYLDFYRHPSPAELHDYIYQGEVRYVEPHSVQNLRNNVLRLNKLLGAHQMKFRVQMSVHRVRALATHQHVVHLDAPQRWGELWVDARSALERSHPGCVAGQSLLSQADMINLAAKYLPGNEKRFIDRALRDGIVSLEGRVTRPMYQWLLVQVDRSE